MKKFVKILREISVFMGILLGVSFSKVIIFEEHYWIPLLIITSIYTIWYIYDLIKNRKYY